MNDFTKNELIAIHACMEIHGDSYSCGLTAHETLVDKLQSMIDNYCEHEYWPADSLVINIPLHCSKCGERFE